MFWHRTFAKHIIISIGLIVAAWVASLFFP
jgi:hypothetical protein